MAVFPHFTLQQIDRGFFTGTKFSLSQTEVSAKTAVFPHCLASSLYNKLTEGFSLEHSFPSLKLRFLQKRQFSLTLHHLHSPTNRQRVFTGTQFSLSQIEVFCENSSFPSLSDIFTLQQINRGFFTGTQFYLSQTEVSAKMAVFPHSPASSLYNKSTEGFSLEHSFPSLKLRFLQKRQFSLTLWHLHSTTNRQRVFH